jgi:K+-transporting ATPase ATPase C chain
MIHVSNMNDLLDRPAEPAPTTESETSPRRPSIGALASITGRQLLVALRFLIAMTVILGVLYPLLVLGIGRFIAPAKANGSLVSVGGAVVGSSLVGQNFTEAKWFQGRPSAAGSDGYDSMSSGGSNLSANSADLLKLVEERRAAIAKADGVAPSAIPPDALTASGSGLDPDISQAYALIQVNRVAKARNLDATAVRNLVETQTSEPILGFIGQERVNVLKLNIALQTMKP